jgi:hypothetical protein
MQQVTISLKHVASERSLPCGVCGAQFVPAEDSGSRMLSMTAPDEEFATVMCGGCYSKWSHGKTVTARRAQPR